MQPLTLKLTPLFSCACLLLSASISHAQICKTDSIEATTPTNRFTTVGVKSGEIKDTFTGLIWQRCSIGQTWNGTTCTGEATKHTWQDALIQVKAMGAGYRVPNIKELTSIVEFQCAGPAINLHNFPNTLPNGYWSSSPHSHGKTYGWYVQFNYGHPNDSYKHVKQYVRAVRSDNNR